MIINDNLLSLMFDYELLLCEMDYILFLCVNQIKQYMIMVLNYCLC